MGMEHIRQRRAIDDDDEGGEADAVRRGSVLSAAGAMSATIKKASRRDIRKRAK